MHNGRAEPIRFAEIDCPKHSQIFSEKTNGFTHSMAFGKDVTVRVKVIDHYGRTERNHLTRPLTSLKSTTVFLDSLVAFLLISAWQP